MSGEELATLALPEPAIAEPLGRQRADWRRELAEAPGGLELPVDRPRPPVLSRRGATSARRLPADAAARLRQAARREETTLDAFLLAGFAALLARYGGVEDLLLGAVAGRTSPRRPPEPAAPLASALPLRIRWNGDPSFRRLLALAEEALAAALAHADLPFEALASELWPAGDPPRSLPLQALFAGPGAARPAGERTLPVDLSLSIQEVEGEGGKLALLLALDYAVELFDASTAARLLAHYAALLAAAAASPELPLSRLPLLGEAERHQLLVEWNDTESAFPRRALHKLFEEQAAARPDAPAVVWDGGTLTYGELDRQAGRIARRLRRLGVGPESRVALYLERSAEMVAAVLGVLKAGGAYLPIDLSYPRERLELLLEDAAPAAVVGTRRSLASLPGKAPQLAVDLLAVHPATARHLATRLAARSVPGQPSKGLVDRLAGVYRATGGDTRTMMQAMTRALGEDAEPASRKPAPEAEDLSADVPAESLAYVLYTSGSTGTPNGVEVTHGAVARLVRETGYLSFGPREVFLQVALLSFDASTLELWWPLANGGCVALPPPGRFALGDLYEQVERLGVTALFLTTGLFHVAVEEGLAGLAGLSHLLVGGDVMSRGHLEQAMAALPGVEIVHSYGPTENTVFASTYRVRAGLEEGSVTIGRPIATCRAYVLDPALAPVPVGCAGELYLAGPGLARGYLARRELTAERFLPNPFEEGRLYKTGDLVRWRADGTLAFLGRHDFQVKVRGFRVEPGEIENALLQHPQVREAAVVGLAEGGRDHRVVAYYVMEAGAEATSLDLRAFLRARLPEHMVPAAFVPLPALPLTGVGKLDRRALPAPEALGPAAGEPAAAARRAVARDPSDLGDLGDLVTQLLAGLWEEVLDPDPRRGSAADGALAFEASRRLGVHDDFFDLGGHSLSVMRLLSRIRQTFGVELGAQTIFAFPTLSAQARVVAAARRGEESALPPLAKIPRQGPPALSFAQQRLWFLDRLAPESPLYNVPAAWLLSGGSLRRRSPPPSPRSSAGTRRCVPGSSRWTASPGRRSAPPGGCRCRRWTSAASGGSGAWASWRACAPTRRAGRSTSPAAPCCGPAWCGWARRSTRNCLGTRALRTRFCSPCTTSSTTAGPKGCSRPSSRRSTRRPSRGVPRRSASSRCSTPTSPPGSAPGRRRCSGGSSPTGATSSRGRRRRCRCRSTGRARRRRASAARARCSACRRRRRQGCARRRGGRGRRSTCCSSPASRRSWRAPPARRTCSSAHRSPTARGRRSRG